MTDRPAELKRQIRHAVFWAYAAPVLMTWTVCSFLPVSSLLMPAMPIAALLGHAAFLATGFGGILGLIVATQLLQAPERKGLTVRDILKGKAVFFTLYATAWLVAYAAFVFFRPGF